MITLTSRNLTTPLGSMLAVADERALYLLEFVEHAKLPQKITWFEKRVYANIIPGSNQILQSMEAELKDYFSGHLRQFNTPIQFLGSLFQQSVWEQLQKVPFGKTRSYVELAQLIGNKTAHRAVANANGANLLSIIVPCHRVINANGKRGGYGGGLSRKEWLLDHEKKRSIS